MKTDTIAAIATGMTPSGIGIIRISGEDAFSIASSVFHKKNKEPISDYEDHRAISVMFMIMVLLLMK